MSKSQIAAFATVIYLTLAMSVVSAGAQRKTDLQDSAAEKSVKKFLQTLDTDKGTRYLAAFRDLNGDGKPEAIVYMIGSEWCGSGGCHLFILAQKGDSWRVVTRTTITQLPVRVLSSTSHGWRDLAVWVQGGGIQPGYASELRFNGKTYPKNPSVPPARRLTGNPGGELIMQSIDDAKPLHGDSKASP